MTAPVTVRGRDLRALAAIVSQDRPALPDGEGLPPSLLADLTDQIRCDGISFERFDSRRRGWLLQSFPALADDEFKTREDRDPAQVAHYYACHLACRSCGYPERTGDVRSVVKPSDFYSARWHPKAL